MDTTEKVNEVHKEERKGRISADTVDRLSVHTALKKYIHPLDVNHHASNMLVNIWSGKEAAEEVNVNKSVEIGLCQMKEYQER